MDRLPPSTATSKDFADTFDLMPCGKRVLDDLLAQHATTLFVPGEEGRRQTDFNLGAKSVLDYILTRTDAGIHGKEPHAPAPQLPAAR